MKALLSILFAATVSLNGLASSAYTKGPSPFNDTELKERIQDLHERYQPFLRSLPEPAQERPRTMLNGEWRFIFEVKDPPEDETHAIPEAPAWGVPDLDDSTWLTTTVPEWRYRTRGNDNTPSIEGKETWKEYTKTRATSQICWYRRTFQAEQARDGERHWLCFDGVDWEAQVYLNGELLGQHRIYYEPFRFDVTDKIREGENTLAVRVVDGLIYGEPIAYWSIFPDVRAQDQRYTPKRSESIRGNLPIGYHVGTGFGIWRDVYLEKTGATRIDKVFVRNDNSDGCAHIKVEVNAAREQRLELQVEIMPENFEGPGFVEKVKVDLPAGDSVQTVKVPMPDAVKWSPDTPHLYRCRIRLGGDSKDALFGCRSFTLQAQAEERTDYKLAEAMFLLNGEPCHLRGTNIQGLNAYAYWGEDDKLLHTILMLKAAHFNAVRSCQHIQMPEVREMLDRLGIFSGQEQGAGYKGRPPIGPLVGPQHLATATVLTRETYNNPGVALLTFGNEHEFPTGELVRAGLEFDPQRIFKPISGRYTHSKKPWDMPEELRSHTIDDGHPYRGWYWTVRPRTWDYPTPLDKNLGGGQRMVTTGEFGAEALDGYETMLTYPPQFAPPSIDTDTLWAGCQVKKDDIKQMAGLGRKPTNLGEYIEASQRYQASLMADRVIQMRLLPHGVSGYFQFHFIDVVPAFWPKSIVSHDHRPKRAYYSIAQANQPIVALPQLSGQRPDSMTLWACNDTVDPIPGATVHWDIQHAGKTYIEGSREIDIRAVDATEVATIDLKPVTWVYPDCDLKFTIKAADGRIVSTYRREIRCVPESLLDEDIREEVENHFEQKR